MSNKNLVIKKQTGFTIVELLVVIVVIGILAAITIISYTGISQRAAVATLQSDLKSAATQLGIDSVYNGAYPSSALDANGGLGLAKSPGTIYSYIASASGYCLSATSTSANTTYHISTGGAIESGGCTVMWSTIVNNGDVSCSVGNDSKAYCWGTNSFGQLGNNSTTLSSVPIAVDTSGVLSGLTIRSISTGTYHSCVVASDNNAYCWGRNSNGQLGNNSIEQSNVPVAVDTSGVLSGLSIESVVAGDFHSCALASNHRVYCWGYNYAGALGDNTTVQKLVPVAVNIAGVLSGKNIQFLTAGDYYNCALDTDNNAYCWGNGTSGQLGDGSAVNRLVPVAVNTSGLLSGLTIKSIATGYEHTCAIASNDLAYCWGDNYRGRLGDGTINASNLAIAVDTTGVLNGKTISRIAVGKFHACVIDSDSALACWGANVTGQLGFNSAALDSYIPVSVYTTGVLSGKTIGAVAAGENHSCAIDSENQAYCWGAGTSGQLGNNATSNRTIPVIVSPMP